MHDLIIENINKIYGDIQALNDFSLNVEQSQLFGLIGPDGAGKTSLFRILTTLLLPDSGKAYVCGYDIIKDYKHIRNICGYMPGRFSLYQDLSVEENLNFFATLFGTSIQQNYDLIKDIYMQIEPFKTRKAGKLSGGMKQKLALCCALIHRPKILFLDEPTTGVDPVSRSEFWDMLSRLKQQGITILVSTPYMDEASRCDKMVLMKDGNILTNNTPNNIIESFAHTLYSAKGDNMFQLLNQIREFKGTNSCFAFGDSHHITLKNNCNIDELKQFLSKKQIQHIDLNIINPTIEDCFMLLS